ncbi:MAG: hypothetical protein U1F57_09955 [bacterium]
MFPLLIAAGLTALTFLSGCERRPHPPPDDAPPPVPPGRSGENWVPRLPTSGASDVFYERRLPLSNARREYQDLCEVLFDQRDLERCDRIEERQALTESPSAERGLNAYFRGIRSHLSGFHYPFSDREARWSYGLHRLEAAELYLKGDGNLISHSLRDVSERQEATSRFDCEEDYFNLVGAFFFLQSRRTPHLEGWQCSLVFLAREDTRDPSAVRFRHPILSAPISPSLRNALQNFPLPLSGGQESECESFLYNDPY